MQLKRNECLERVVSAALQKQQEKVKTNKAAYFTIF